MTELLSPAGSKEALIAAVQSGADAVYLGVDDFNARRGARNFSPEDLRAVCSYCHVRGVKVYLTLNTLVNDRELRHLANTARAASDAGVDAILVQDWGVLDTLKRVVPDVPLHASTQMTVHNLSGVEEAARLGLSRVVLARELSREDIRELCKKSPIELEVFVHGALCVCWSGQCSMSAVIGQRSGNRGFCAQPCRLPYNGGGHPLSLRDNNLSAYLPELADMGVSCLKLEGRMKRPEYVAAVTGIYARLLRERRGPTEEESAQLSAAFSRDGFTDGYYTGNKGPQMFGVRPKDARWPEDWFARLRSEYDGGDLRRVGIDLSVRIRREEPIRLTAADRGGNEVSVTGPRPEPARTRSVTAEEVRTRLSKTGGTAFVVESCRVELDEGLAVSAAALNGLRRNASAALEELRGAPPARRTESFRAPEERENPVEPPRFTVSLRSAAQLTPELVALRPAVVYLPAEELLRCDLSPYLGQTRFCAQLPRIYRTADEGTLRELLRQAARRGASAVGVGNLGHLGLCREFDLEKRGDLSLNVFNSAALSCLKENGLDTAALSFELRWEQLRDIQKCLPCEAVIYGRLPLMVTENRIDAPGGVLTDRRGEKFPVLEVFGGRWEIENAKTLCLLARPDWRSIGLSFVRLRFTTETPAQCAEILRAHVEGADYEPEDVTRGLFYRGVE